MVMKCMLVILGLLGSLQAKHSKTWKKAGHRITHKNTSPLHELMSPVNEGRMHTFGRLTTDKEVMRRLLGEGLTNNYQQMLQNQKDYFISNGLTTYNGKLDVDKQVVIGHHPSQTQVGYTYGEVEPEDEEKKRREAFTSNYEEMLTNPEKKILVLGVHPELNTASTRYLKQEYEDPIIQPNDMTLKELEQERRKAEEERLAKIDKFLQIVQKELADKQSVTAKQQEILSNLQQFMGVGDQGVSEGVHKYMKSINDLVAQIKEAGQPKEQKKEKKDEKKDKVQQAMRLLSTLETVTNAKPQDKAPILLDIQRQQDDLEHSLDMNNNDQKKKTTLHKKVKKALKKKQ